MNLPRPSPKILALGASCLATSLGLTPAAAQPAADDWQFSAGIGIASQPDYPGSGERETRGLPLISVSRGRYFLGGAPGTGVPFGLGVNLVQDGPWRFGIGLGGQLSKPREESDSPRLRGLGDIDRTALGSVFGGYSLGWFAVRGSVVTDIGGDDQGTRATLDLEGRYSLTPSLVLSAGPGLTWADARYTQRFFGVSSAQSAASGLPAYEAGGGLHALRFGVGATVLLGPNWSVGARAAAVSLRGDARDSPITESTSQNTYSLFATYRF